MLEEKRRRSFFHINHSNIFFDLSPRVMTTKIKKWDLIKLKTLYPEKEIIKMKRKPTEWEKIFANKATNKGLISKIDSNS